VDHLQRAQSASPAAPAGGAASPDLITGTPRGQIGHGEDKLPGGTSAGAFGSPPVPPITGTISFQHPLAATADPQLLSSQIIAGLGSNAPNFPFPPFSGDNPNLWMTLGKQYFQMFLVHESYWVPMSILHFSGAAGIWLQSVRKKISTLDWVSFTSLLCTRFGRCRHQLLIR
jgi:hypothetical protein